MFLNVFQWLRGWNDFALSFPLFYNENSEMRLDCLTFSNSICLQKMLLYESLNNVRLFHWMDESLQIYRLYFSSFLNLERGTYS